MAVLDLRREKFDLDLHLRYVGLAADDCLLLVREILRHSRVETQAELVHFFGICPTLMTRPEILPGRRRLRLTRCRGSGKCLAEHGQQFGCAACGSTLGRSAAC